MRIITLKSFDEQYAALSERLKSKVDTQLHILQTNLRHPSLRAKKYDAANNIWQARATLKWRFYFQIHGDTYIVLSVIPHPK